MKKIVGVTVGTALSPDKIKEMIKPVLSVNGVKADESGNVKQVFDYEQNDATALDYIKNRPFYGNYALILDNKTYSNEQWGVGVNVDFDLEEGKEYQITINSEDVFVCLCKADEEYGKTLEYSDKFVIDVNDGILNAAFFDYGNDETVQLKIEEYIKKIDKKYLPENIGGGVGKPGTGASAEMFNSAIEASGGASHAEGLGTRAKGDMSHAEGSMTKATGTASHAEGIQTTASNDAAHAEGQATEASGVNSHAEGFFTNASGVNSHAEGNHTNAVAANSHVQGKYNVADSEEEYAHIVGNGSSAARSNAHTLDWDGNAWFSGDVYVGSTSGVNKDEGSKKLATEEYVDSKGGGGTPIDVTAEVGQTIIVKEVDANGKPTKWESADYQPRTHYMETILPETALSIDPEEGVGFIPQDLALNVGDGVSVIYNGAEYDCIVIDVGDGIKALGNMGGIDENFSNTGEPFVIVYSSLGGDDMVWFIGPLDGSSSVALSIGKHVPIPQAYLTNAFPYYVYIKAQTEGNDIVYECNESVENLISNYKSGRPLALKCEYWNVLNSSDGITLRYTSYTSAVTVTPDCKSFMFSIGASLLTLEAQEDDTFTVSDESPIV